MSMASWLRPNLADADNYDAVKNARLDGEIVRYGSGQCLAPFERLEVFPRGLIPIGDSICRFNPVHGRA